MLDAALKLRSGTRCFHHFLISWSVQGFQKHSYYWEVNISMWDAEDKLEKKQESFTEGDFRGAFKILMDSMSLLPVQWGENQPFTSTPMFQGLTHHNCHFIGFCDSVFTNVLFEWKTKIWISSKKENIVSIFFKWMTLGNHWSRARRRGWKKHVMVDNVKWLKMSWNEWKCTISKKIAGVPWLPQWSCPEAFTKTATPKVEMFR